eukprot:g5488.t1
MAIRRGTSDFALYWAALYNSMEACTQALEGDVYLEFLDEHPGYKVTDVDTNTRGQYKRDWVEAELGRTAVHEAAINGNEKLVNMLLGKGWRSDVVDKYREITDSAGEQDYQHVNITPGKRPRDYAFLNGHFLLSKKLFLKDLERLIDTNRRDARMKRFVGEIVTYMCNEESGESSRHYKDKRVEDTLVYTLTNLRRLTTSNTIVGEALIEAIPKPDEMRKDQLIKYTELVRQMRYLIIDQDLNWRLPGHLQKREYPETPDFGVLEEDLDEIKDVAIQSTVPDHVKAKVNRADELRNLVTYYGDQEQDARMKLTRAQEDIGIVALDSIRNIASKTAAKKRKVGGGAAAPVEELQSVDEFVDFLIGDRSDATPFIAALEALTRLFRKELDIRKPMR